MKRLETVTVEEARMAAAEALKAIHGVGDEVQGIHDAVKAVGDCVRDVKDMIQGVDDRVKGIGNMVAIGAHRMLKLSSLSSIFIQLRVETTGRQMESGPDVIDSDAESPKTTNGANNKIEHRVNNMVSDHDILKGAPCGVENADHLQGTIKETEATGRSVKGAHIICNLSLEPLPSVS